jgi:hypothetical protein
MTSLEKNQLLELEILKHVEQSPRLNNRMAASKLGCSVKLSHELLAKMVGRGLLHVKKLHSRRWDYFLTPKGMAEKARLTLEFLEFSMQFYKEARKASSSLCRNLAEKGITKVSFIGAGDLAEIVYLGVKEWNLDLQEIYDDDNEHFLGHQVKSLSELDSSEAEALIVCLYNRKYPMTGPYLPEGLEKDHRMYWVFTEMLAPETKEKG